MITIYNMICDVLVAPYACKLVTEKYEVLECSCRRVETIVNCVYPQSFINPRTVRF